MLDKICYLGDNSLGGAARYLAGVMIHFGLDFDHVKNSNPPDGEFTSRQYRLYVVSDYPARQFRPEQIKYIARCVRNGSGLVMFGGWESFYGRQGEYHLSPLADVLPVEMADADDRRNFAQPCLIKKISDHAILAGLPWSQPPSIGGYNAFRAKSDSQTLLSSVAFSVKLEDDVFSFTPHEEKPLLVVGRHGQGRAAALATDIAPHWVGGLVDWGNRRFVQAVKDDFIDVGNWYAIFLQQLLCWTGQLSECAKLVNGPNKSSM